MLPPIAAYLASESVRRQIQDLVEDPIYSHIADPRPFKRTPESIALQLKKGDRLFRPSGDAEYEQRFSAVAEDRETVLHEWHDRIIGCWRMTQITTLRLPVPMRSDLMPVWVLSLYGEYAERVIGDEETLEKLHVHLARSARLRFKERGHFTPRGLPHAEDDLAYEIAVEGSFEHFSGSERILEDGIEMWSARFHGGTIIPIS